MMQSPGFRGCAKGLGYPHLCHEFLHEWCGQALELILDKQPLIVRRRSSLVKQLPKSLVENLGQRRLGRRSCQQREGGRRGVKMMRLKVRMVVLLVSVAAMFVVVLVMK